MTHMNELQLLLATGLFVVSSGFLCLLLSGISMLWRGARRWWSELS